MRASPSKSMPSRLYKDPVGNLAFAAPQAMDREVGAIVSRSIIGCIGVIGSEVVGARNSVMVVGPDRSVFCRIVDQLAQSPSQSFDLSWADSSRAAIERLSEEEFEVCIADSALGRTALREIVEAIEEAGAATSFIPLGDDGRDLQRESRVSGGGGTFLLRSEIDTRGLEAAVAWSLAHGRAAMRYESTARRLEVLERGCEIGLWYWDTALDHVRLSGKAAEVLGLPDEPCEIPISRLLAAISSDDRARVQEEFEALGRGSRPKPAIEFKIKRRGGKDAKVAIHVQSSHGHGGNRLVVGGSMRCIESAAESDSSVAGMLTEGWAFSMLESAARAMLQVGDAGRILYANPAAAELFGYAREEMTCLSLSDLFACATSEDESSSVDWIYEEASAERCSGSHSTLGRHASGARIAIEYWSRSMGDDEDLAFIEVRRIEAREGTSGAYLGFGVPDTRAPIRSRQAFADQVGQELARVRRQSTQQFAVIHIGIERYASYLEALDEAGVQILLDRLTSRLRTCLRPQDAVCPLESGNFLLLLEGISGEGDALRVSERVQESLHCRVEVGGRGLYVTCRMGITMGTPASIETRDILQEAYHAMLAARAERLSVARIFREAEHRKAWSHLERERNLREAVVRNELELLYQPVVSLGGGQLLAFEALVRWRGGDGTLHTPADFMEIAAQTGLVVPLGRWVIREACRQVIEWGPLFGDAKSKVAISVNLSTHEAIQPDLVPAIREILHETGAPPEALHLEIREDLLGMSDGYGERVISRLSALGVGVVLDGLTAGSSAITSLQHLPVEVVKLDRSLLDEMRRGLDHRATIEAVVSLGNRSGKEIVVVGIESEYQATHLGTLGCHGGQGYYFSKPMCVKEATKYLGQRPVGERRGTLIPS